MKKVVVPGLVSGAVMFLVGIVVSIVTVKLFPDLMREYNNFFIFRSGKDSIMNLYYVQPFVLGLILAWVWDAVKKSVKGKGLQKGVNFGLVYGLTVIPGMIMSYASFKISLGMVLSWTVSVFITGVLAGMVYAKMNK